jgi:hypothetical protein
LKVVQDPAIESLERATLFLLLVQNEHGFDPGVSQFSGHAAASESGSAMTVIQKTIENSHSDISLHILRRRGSKKKSRVSE